MSSDVNLKFWDSVQTTDPEMTKQANVSGQLRTSVDAQYKKKLITKKFGMFGLGWGVIAESEVYDRVKYENNTTILNYRATCFYVYEGQRATFPIASSIKESYQTRGDNSYLKIDDEATKKVRTDALTKGFTDLGFCSDIHMGMFDDSAYLVGAAAKHELEKAEEMEEAINQAMTEISEYCRTELDAIQKIERKRPYEAAVNRIVKSIRTRCLAAGIHPNTYVKPFESEAAKKVFKND